MNTYKNLAMPKHLQRDIDNLKQQLLYLCSVVENQLALATRAITTQDENLSKEIAESDDEIDRREVEIEESCLKTLALHQPVAIDLRMVTAIMKINNDLERIGDMVCNIGKNGARVAKESPVSYNFDFKEIARLTGIALKQSIDALVNEDADLAMEIAKVKREAEAMNRELRKDAVEQIMNDPANTKTYLRYRSISRNYKRIVDLSSNIAEDIIYMINGVIVRHNYEKFADDDDE
jgi:phosphate transport system protein